VPPVEANLKAPAEGVATRRSARARRRAELRDALLGAIEQRVGAGDSFASLSVEELAAEVGVSRSTFYVYFEDKGDLLRAWFAEIHEQLSAAALRWWALDGAATEADLRAALEHIVLTYRPHLVLMAEMYDAAVYDDAVRDEVDQMMKRNIIGLRNHLRDGRQKGYVAAELDPEETAAWLTWMAERGLHRRVRYATDEALGGIVDTYTRIVWNSVYADAPSRT
jgi:TetR/AcrR family transcriptional regulator, ethionamide resistance regulator